MKSAYFRANVGALVTDQRGWVLVLRRRGVAQGGWQMPQGGIERGEAPQDALWRELAEETGLARAEVELVSELPRWIAYELPRELQSEKTGLGQVQRWFVLRARPGARPAPDGVEFEAFEWVEPAEVLARAVAFRLPVYEEVLAAAGLRPARPSPR